jgi:DNA-binding PadR family transcriptional regulator
MSQEVPVKASLLELLAREPKRYSDIVRELGRPDKTVYVTLAALSEMKFVAKDDEGKYILTDEGKRELERLRFMRIAQEEDDLEIILNTRLAIALERCYNLLFDLRYLLARTFLKSRAEDSRRVREQQDVIRNLLLKYNPSLRKAELEKEERNTLGIGLKELFSGGIWWGKRFVKWGLKDRYLHLLTLERELPESRVREEIIASLLLFSDTVGKLDERLKDLPTVASA